MKSHYECWVSAFNAQCLRVIIIVVGAMKIYVAIMEMLKKKERGNETQFITKIVGQTSLNYFVW